jgi:hypothetical protein
MLPHPMQPFPFYKNNPAAFLADRPIIEKFAEYLRKRETSEKNAPTTDIQRISGIPANELSFRVFADEKKLLADGIPVLKRLRMSLQSLDCFQTSEPFVFFSYASPIRQVLISENRDSFFSLHLAAKSGFRLLTGSAFDVLIFGEGRKIISSLTFGRDMLDVTPDRVRFQYWGDLDPEGAAIFLNLRSSFPEYDIQPATALYSAMFIDNMEYPRQSRSTRILEIEPFFTYFPNDLAEKIRRLFADSRYLPQESVCYHRLRSILKNA